MASSSSSDTQVADRYATALFELAAEAGELDRGEAVMRALRETFEGGPELTAALRNPAFSRDDKKAVMMRVADGLAGAAGGAWPTLEGLLSALEGHGRFAVLPAICNRFLELMAAHRGETRAQVTAARPLSDTQIDALAAKIQEAVGGIVKLDITIDPSLIGGLIIRVGSKMIDSSIRSKLSNLQTVMKEVG
ncbi:MAG: ATP synthase F1 subunit delta [Pseudomonadota bacterium]